MIITLSCFFLLLSFACTKFFFKLAQDSKLIDRPNDRTLHDVPTVRGGGLVFIGLFLIFLPFICYIYDTSFLEWFSLFLSVVLLATISFLDDLYHLSVKIRFGVQCVVALIIALFLKPEQLDFIFFSLTNEYLIVPFIFFTVIWAINHFNFMDGLDGFCALQAIFLLGFYFILFNGYHALVPQDFCLILICGLSSFLAFNFPPAKLFMGDIGSASLGLIIFSLALIGQQKYQIPLLYWFMMNGLFLFDSTITLFRRVLHKERWSLPHKKHAYQRLKQSGMEVKFILLGQIIINIIFSFSIYLIQVRHCNIYLILSFQLTLLLFVYYLIEKKYSMF